MADEIAINIDNISFRYLDTPILENISLHVKTGEFLAVFGPNGGGKTTLLKALLGFVKPERGSIEIFGQPPLSARQIIGYVPQILRFDRQFPISVLEIVLMGCLSEISVWGTFPRGYKKRACEALALVGMENHAAEAFGTLSGGQVQRVLLARALMGKPRLLLLDEPIASVDQDAEEEIYRILLRLKGETTIIMVTHDLQSMLTKCDRLLCVQRRATIMDPAQICEHFTLGLYHPPLVQPPVPPPAKAML